MVHSGIIRDIRERNCIIGTVRMTAEHDKLMAFSDKCSLE
jgi:hypothetical protein